MNDHDRGFLEFLAEPNRRRMKTLLELGEKRRRDVRSHLHHAVHFDPRFSQHLTGSDAFSIIGMGNGAYVSCIPGRLGFYEYEDMKSSYLLSK